MKEWLFLRLLLFVTSCPIFYACWQPGPRIEKNKIPGKWRKETRPATSFYSTNPVDIPKNPRRNFAFK